MITSLFEVDKLVNKQKNRLSSYTLKRSYQLSTLFIYIKHSKTTLKAKSSNNTKRDKHLDLLVFEPFHESDDLDFLGPSGYHSSSLFQQTIFGTKIF